MQNVSFNRFTAVKFIFILLLFSPLLSCSDIFEEDLSDDAVILITPFDQDTSTIQSQLFRWEEIEEAVEYRIQIVSPSFASINNYVLDTTITTAQIYHTLEPGTYQWRVKAMNHSSESGFSNPFTIVIDTTSDLTNQIVVLSIPAAAADLNDTLVAFSWQAMGIADSYNIVLKSGTNWTTGSVLMDDTVTNNFYNSTLALDEGQYLWGVRAINTISYTTSFNQRTLNIDLTDPPKPVPSSPANSSTQTQGSIGFSWTRPADAGTYNSPRFDSLYVFSDSAMVVPVGKFHATNTNYSISINQNDTYFWYLIGFDNAGNKSDTSTVFSFTVQ